MSAMAAETGLQPVLHIAVGGGRPENDFYAPCDVTQLDEMSAEQILADLWRQKTVEIVDGKALEEGDPGFDPRLAEHYKPFSRQFPGLAPSPDMKLTEAETSRAVDSLPAAHLCLVAASRAADIPAAVGWMATDAWSSALPVSAVLRSWEERFEARLVQIGPGAELRLLVGRPPRTLAAAEAITAELWAFCDAWVDQHHELELTSIRRIAPHAIAAPIWGFWWD